MITGSVEQAESRLDSAVEAEESAAQARAVGARGERVNALALAASAYLRSARYQPVDWMEWGAAAFDRAVAEDKPILLDIGAVWCHWCHVMDRESYENIETARLINEHFIAVKVDRDERPDVDTRYQAAVSSISGQGGWPLTAFLNTEGKPYFGGTYFPPDDRHGRPGFRRVLLTMAEAFLNRRAEVDESAGSVMSAIEQNESFAGHQGDPGPELVEKMLLSIVKSVDLRHGGFGSQPKFPHSGAVDLMIDAASRRPRTTLALAGGQTTMPEAAKRAVLLTLDKMSKGGIYDHLAGGFHRYSVDEYWVVPHFEKMAYDNSELLKNYVHAYQTFAEPECRRVALDMMRWMDEWLTDRDRGGFYASQDADFSLDDDGDYFTWTRDEMLEVLTADEMAIASAFYDVGEIGDMHHNVAKNVLHVKLGLDAVARKAGGTLDAARATLASAKQKMYAARLKRPTPYVDKTIYVAWNAMCISAYLQAARVFELAGAREFALKSLDRVLRSAWRAADGGTAGRLAHVVAYGDHEDAPERVDGVLDDYVALGHAALDAWEATGALRYYDAAEAVLRAALARFYDTEHGAFFDTEAPAPGERMLGVLSARRKPLQDSPTPAGNPTGAALLMRMEALSGTLAYGDKAQKTMEAFAGVVEHFGLYAASYALALQRMVEEPVLVCVIGEDADAMELERAALIGYAVNKSVVRLRKDQLGALPPALAETLPHLPGIEGSFAVVCCGNSCQLPAASVEELLEMLGKSV